MNGDGDGPSLHEVRALWIVWLAVRKSSLTAIPNVSFAVSIAFCPQEPHAMVAFRE